MLPLLSILCVGLFKSYAQEIKPAYQLEKIKIAVREIGNSLLLDNNDSTSLVMPVKKLKDNEFELSFQYDLSISPEILISATKTAFIRSEIISDYITEVLDCRMQEVVYSYQSKGALENNLVSCGGRKLSNSCYTIRIIFISTENSSLPPTSIVKSTINNATISTSSIPGTTYLISTLLILFILTTGVLLVKYQIIKRHLPDQSDKSVKIGNSIFYPEQQLVKRGDHKIDLTVKESELLKIFSQSPNQIIKREELLKMVWEDHGVVVGRSLDMFISKLRKKLHYDATVKIVNIHGVGYKMEV
ncbi:winged helix-turn-helix domain-containing protein [Aquimarina sp. AU474]|uniref:winged helix-turn-helix domain-containing protein n=1 Tax=Aquimarina sp. AU474 TaxID=2108529 RepID=UPI000D6966A7|nr:winged helix-turn-helix domain-containing protein [Aquimarina sp. AU474]